MPQLDIPYEIVGADGTRAVWNDPSDPDHVGYLDEVTGLGEAEIRVEADDLTEDDGGVHGDFFRGRMPFTFKGWIDPGDVDDMVATVARESKVKRAARALRGDGTVSWTPAGSIRRQVRFRTVQPPRVTDKRPKMVLLSLESASHRMYAAAESNAGFLAGAGVGEIGVSSPVTSPFASSIDSTGAVSIVNVGDEDTPPRYRIDGPITNPIIRNGATGEELRFVATLAAGEWLAVDVAARTVLLNGTADRYRTVQFPGSKWWLLRPGANDVRLLATAYAAPAGLTTYWRSAWS